MRTGDWLVFWVPDPSTHAECDWIAPDAKNIFAGEFPRKSRRLAQGEPSPATLLR